MLQVGCVGHLKFLKESHRHLSHAIVSEGKQPNCVLRTKQQKS